MKPFKGILEFEKYIGMGFSVIGEWEDRTPQGATAQDWLDGNLSWGGWIQREDGAHIPQGIYKLVLDDGNKSRTVSIAFLTSMSSTRTTFSGWGPYPT